MSLSRGCRILGVSRQAVYQHRQRQLQRTRELAPLLQWVQSYRMLMPRLGGRKLYSLLKARLVRHGIKLGRDGFFDFLREQDLLVKPKRNYTKTTWSRHWMRKHPNQLKEAPPPSAPEQVLQQNDPPVRQRLAVLCSAVSAGIVQSPQKESQIQPVSGSGKTVNVFQDGTVSCIRSAASAGCICIPRQRIERMPAGMFSLG